MNTPDTSALLRPGDRVAVATSFGDGPIHESIVIGIYTYESVALEAVPWAILTDRAIDVDLANGHWAYGYQLSRPSDPSTSQPSK